MCEGGGGEGDGVREGVREEGERRELGPNQNLDPDPWKIFKIRIRQNDADL